MGFQENFKKVIGLTEEEDFGAEYQEEEVGRKRSKSQSLRRGKEDIAVFEVKHSEEVQEVATYLKNKSSCIINMQRCDEEVEKTVISFLSGTVFAIDGDIFNIGVKMYLCTPNGIGTSIPGDLTGTGQSEVDGLSKVINKTDAFSN